MIRRRSVSLALGASTLGINPSATRTGFSFLQSAEAQVDPYTVIQVASFALSAVSQFSEKSDGGLSAMLGAQTAYLALITSQLSSVISALGDMSAQLKLLPEQMRSANELDRLLLYYDSICSAGRQFQELYNTEQHATATQVQQMQRSYSRVADRVGDARTSLQSYCSIVPAMALPLSLGVEIAARAKALQKNRIPEALRSYRKWTSQILDPRHKDSVAWNLKMKLIPLHSNQVQACDKLFRAKACSPAEHATGATEEAECFQPAFGQPPLDPVAVRVSYSIPISAQSKEGAILLTVAAPIEQVAITNDPNCTKVKIISPDGHGGRVATFSNDGAYYSAPALVNDFVNVLGAVSRPKAAKVFGEITASVDAVNNTRTNIAAHLSALTIVESTQTRINELMVRS